MIIDPRNNYRIDEKSDNRNLNEYEEQAKKAYTTVKQKRKVENEIVTIPLNKIQNIEVVNDKQESGQIKKNIFNKKTLKNFLRVFCCMIFEKLFSVKVFICIRSYFFTFFRFFFISFSLRLTFFDRF